MNFSTVISRVTRSPKTPFRLPMSPPTSWLSVKLSRIFLAEMTPGSWLPPSSGSDAAPSISPKAMPEAGRQRSLQQPGRVNSRWVTPSVTPSLPPGAEQGTRSRGDASPQPLGRSLRWRRRSSHTPRPPPCGPPRPSPAAAAERRPGPARPYPASPAAPHSGRLSAETRATAPGTAGEALSPRPAPTRPDPPAPARITLATAAELPASLPRARRRAQPPAYGAPRGTKGCRDGCAPARGLAPPRCRRAGWEDGLAGAGAGRAGRRFPAFIWDPLVCRTGEPVAGVSSVSRETPLFISAASLLGRRAQKLPHAGRNRPECASRVVLHGLPQVCAEGNRVTPFSVTSPTHAKTLNYMVKFVT